MKNAFWSNPWFLIPAMFFINAGLLLFLLHPTGVEVLYLNPWRTEPLNSFFRFCTKLGEPLAFVVFGLWAMLWRFRYALLIAIAGLILLPVTYILKDQIGTDRPITFFEKKGLRDAVETVPGVDLNAGQTSFPSGHTLAAFCLYGLLSLMSRRKAPWLGLAWAWTAILVALSRIFLVQHFLLDVVGGACLGIFLSLLVWEINERIIQKWPSLDRGLLPLNQIA